MQTSVGEAAVPLEVGQGQAVVIQNLGPGLLYIELGADATVEGGLQVPIGKALELHSPGGVSVIADAADTDVRYLLVG